MFLNTDAVVNQDAVEATPNAWIDAFISALHADGGGAWRSKRMKRSKRSIAALRENESC